MPVRSKAQAAYLGIHHPEILRRWKEEGASTSTAGLPEHVKKHASVPDLLAAMEKDKKTDAKVQKAVAEDQKADAMVRDKLREGESLLRKKAEPDPDRDRQADAEGQVKSDKDRKDDEDSENYYGHGAGAKGKKMNTVKDLLKKKAEDTGAQLGAALQGVKDNAKKSMGAIKPIMPTTTPVATTPGMPAEKKAADAGAELGAAIQGVKENAKKTMGDIKPPAPAPAVKMGPTQNIRASAPPMGKAASAFTSMPNRKDGMFFTKAAGRKDGMFFKQAMDAEGAGDASTGDAMASNEASGAVGSGMGHGKGVKAGIPAKKAKAA